MKNIALTTDRRIMTDTKKYREFWIHKETAILCENRIINIYNRIHFLNLVEKHALTDLQAKYDELERKFINSGLHYNLLKEKADKLRDTVVIYAYEEPNLAKALQEYEQAKGED